MFHKVQKPPRDKEVIEEELKWLKLDNEGPAWFYGQRQRMQYIIKLRQLEEELSLSCIDNTENVDYLDETSLI